MNNYERNNVEVYMGEYDFMKKGKESFQDQVLKIQFIKDMTENPSVQNVELIKALAVNLVNIKQGKEAFMRLILSESMKQDIDLNDIFDKATEYRKKNPAISYEQIVKLGYSGTIPKQFKTPEKEIIHAIKIKMLSDRGFYYDTKNKLQFNVNIFLSYALKRFKILRTAAESYYIYNNLLGYYEEKNEIFIARLFRDVMHEAAKDIWKKSYKADYLDALPLTVTNIKRMNEDKRYINLENGMLNLDTMFLEKHDPKFYSSIRIPIYYKPEAESPLFEKFMTDIMEGDKERISIIEEILGYFLTAETRADKFFIWYGPGGNGKSLLSKIAKLLCGEENVGNLSISDLGEKFGLERIPYKTLNISNENEKIANVGSIQNIKAIASGDRININVKYKEGFDYSPICKLTFLMNTLPEITDNSDGFYRKALIIPFYRKFGESEQDKYLYEKLIKEKEGILICALNGLKRLRTKDYNFTFSKVCNNILASYEKDNNPVIEFIDDCLSLETSGSVSKKDVIDAFKDWADRNGREDISRMSAQTFWSLFKLVLGKKKIEYIEKKSRGIRKIVGFKLMCNENIDSIPNENDDSNNTVVLF